MKAMALGANHQVDDAVTLIDDISSDHSDNDSIVAACVGQKVQIMLDNDRASEAHAMVRTNVESTTGTAREQMQQMLEHIESRMGS